jgi:multidrug efflux pump
VKDGPDGERATDGAMTFIFLGFVSINIYTQAGQVTLMGLISRHGILIVEVANHLRAAGRRKRERSGRLAPTARVRF